jgi:transcriptional regulator
MSTPPDRLDLLQGTLDMLILRTLRFGPAHGHAVGQFIRQTSEEELRIEHGSLYPALHRLERQGLIAAKWDITDRNRKAKFYRLTPTGRRRLTAEETKWDRLARAIGRIMRPA